MEDKNKGKLNVEFLNVKGKLIRNILGIAAILLTVIFFLYPKIFGEDNGIQADYISVKAPRIPLGEREFPFGDIRGDSIEMKKLSKYYEGGIPSSFYKFHNPRENQFLTVEEKLQFKSISEGINEIESILCGDSGRNSNYRTTNLRYIQMWYNCYSEIKILNERNEKIKNLEITVGDGYYSELIDEEFDGIYLDTKKDSMMEFTNSTPIIIDEINPNEVTVINLWSETPIGGLYKLTVNYEGGSEEIKSPLLVTTNSVFDSIITYIITSSKFIQMLLYIAAPIGLFVMYRYIKKIFKFFIDIIKAKEVDGIQ